MNMDRRYTERRATPDLLPCVPAIGGIHAGCIRAERVSEAHFMPQHNAREAKGTKGNHSCRLSINCSLLPPNVVHVFRLERKSFTAPFLVVYTFYATLL